MSTEIRRSYWLLIIIFALVSCDVMEVNENDSKFEDGENITITKPVIDVVELGQFGLGEATDINENGDIIGGYHYWNKSSNSLHELDFTARSLNDGGQVTGDIDGKAYFWEFGKGQLSISHPYDYYEIVEEWVMPYEINNHGEVVGEAWIVDLMTLEASEDFVYLETEEAFQWNSGASAYDMIEPYSSANGINDNGQIVGTHPKGAFKWDSNNGMVFLDSSDDRYEEANAINNRSQIVGSVLKSTSQNLSELVNDVLLVQRITESKSSYDISHMFTLLRKGNTVAKNSDMNLNRFGSFSFKNMQNESLLSIWDTEQQQNSIQNVLSVSLKSEAFLWDADNGNKSLGTLGGDWSTAFDINDHGQVVGYSDIGNDEYRAFYWDRENGMIELPSNGKNSIARAINNNGQIVGENDGPVMWEITLPKSN